MKVPRKKRAAYRSPIRAVHVRETRARIVAAALEELHQARPISLARVAQRAGVAVPTAYRHFRSAPALLRAVLAHILVVLEQSPPAGTLDELAGTLPSVFDHFERHEAVVRARLRMAAVPEVREVTLKRRRNELTRMARALTVGMSSGDAVRVTALVHVLQSAEAWDLMRQYGLSGAEAGKTAAWAMRSLVDAARRQGGLLEVANRAA